MGNNLYTEDFTGPSEDMTNRDWTEVSDSFGNFRFEDVGAYGRIYRHNPPSAGNAKYRYDGAGSAAWEDYQFRTTIEGNFLTSTPDYHFYVRYTAADSILCQVAYNGGSGDQYFLIDGVNQGIEFSPLTDGQVVTIWVTNSGTDVRVEVWVDALKVGDETIDASGRPDILLGSIGYWGAVWRMVAGMSLIEVEDFTQAAVQQAADTVQVQDGPRRIAGFHRLAAEAVSIAEGVVRWMLGLETLPSESRARTFTHQKKPRTFFSGRW
jgi:hypothetical protein